MITYSLSRRNMKFCHCNDNTYRSYHKHNRIYNTLEKQLSDEWDQDCENFVNYKNKLINFKTLYS